MRHLLREILKKTPFYIPLKGWKTKKEQGNEILEWEKSGRPVPPPHVVKQRTLRRYAEKFGLSILVETGTYYGDMVEAMEEYFERIYSIELSRELYDLARTRFADREGIELIHGDSGTELAGVLDRLDRPALFWLDGHYSEGVTAKGDKETPIYDELSLVLDSEDSRHVIIIDDARCFGENPAYPSLEEISDFIRSRKPGATIAVKDDSIRITFEESTDLSPSRENPHAGLKTGQQSS